jgi:hypothetical protein
VAIYYPRGKTILLPLGSEKRYVALETYPPLDGSVASKRPTALHPLLETGISFLMMSQLVLCFREDR